MSLRRGTAAAIALLATIVAAGCGFGPGKGVGEVELTVTRDYGTVPMLHRRLDDLTESDTVMRALERNADITTRYGGGFVQSIDGFEGGGSGAREWFFYVNGLWSPVGAADFPLRGGESVWWDYRDWSVGERVAAAVGSWPQPFAGGYEGSFHPTAVSCLGGGAACATVRERLGEAGAKLAPAGTDGAIRVLVGPWPQVATDRDAELVSKGVSQSGVFAEFDRSGRAFRGLDQHGAPVLEFGPEAGLLAATRRESQPPTWLVTGGSEAGVKAAAGLLDAASLRDHYTVAVEAGEETALPVR